MENSKRRTFLLGVVSVGSALVPLRAHSQGAGPRLEESDPQAIALGYKQDTSKVDRTKFPKHEATQKCSTCQLFLGKPTDVAGNCPLFAGKQVAANGWCSAWAKKAA